MLGSARMMDETGEDPAELRAAVTSPGGTTAAAVRTLEFKAVRSAFIEAVAAATERSKQLGPLGWDAAALRWTVDGRRSTPAVYFLSDYGTRRRVRRGWSTPSSTGCAPAVAGHRLSHQIPPFDVAAGAAMLARARSAPRCGRRAWRWSTRGSGTDRRRVAVGGTVGRLGPRGWSDRTTGCSCPLPSALGGAERVVVLDPGSEPASAADRPTFDGRDLFAPAAAHLVLGARPGRPRHRPSPPSEPGLGGSRAPASTGSGGGRPGPVATDTVVASVTWIDRFGNVQLGTRRPRRCDRLGLPRVTAAVDRHLVTRRRETAPRHPSRARRVAGAFADLDEGELGLIIDSQRAGRRWCFDRASAAARPRVAGPGAQPSVRSGRRSSDPPADWASRLSAPPPRRPTIQASVRRTPTRAPNPRPAAPGPSRRRIPEATVARLPVYQRILEELLRSGTTTVSSELLASAAQVNAAKVRKDLSLLGSFGTRGAGYDAAFLIEQIDRQLGLDRVWPVVIAGIGNLGRALARSQGFAARNFRVTALLDTDPTIIGERVDGVVVRHPDELRASPRTHRWPSA